MKKEKLRSAVFALLTLTILMSSRCNKGEDPTSPPGPTEPKGIASKYPGDAGIQNDPDIIFVEMFEASDVGAVTANWTDKEGVAQMALQPDTPAGSPGNKSMQFTTVGGTVDAVYLYKLLDPGVDDSLFLRYYVKYNTNGTFHHSGGGLGGYNPPSSWPIGGAGIRPTGSDKFKTSIEPYDAGTSPNTSSRMDHYTYWMSMRDNPGDNKYWGNSFINDPAVSIGLSDWACIEIMVKLNKPVTVSNGEMALWINGTKVSHLKQGSPNGSWVWDSFTPGSGPAFEGFQWRNDANLNINWFSLQHFVSQDANGQQSSIYYDHVVAAKSYIGPIQP